MKSFLLALLFISSSLVKAQTPVLVKDLYPGEIGGADFSHKESEYIGDAFVFSANTPETGIEMFYLKDGEIDLLYDLYPGENGSFPEDLKVFNDKLYFKATTDEYRTSIWVTDGTPEGTEMVSHQPDHFSSGYQDYFVFPDGIIYTVHSNYITKTIPGELEAKLIEGGPNINEFDAIRSATKYRDGLAFIFERFDERTLWMITDSVYLLDKYMESKEVQWIRGMSEINGDLIFYQRLRSGADYTGNVMMYEESTVKIRELNDRQFGYFNHAPDNKKVYYVDNQGFWKYDGTNDDGEKIYDGWSKALNVNSGGWEKEQIGDKLYFMSSDLEISQTDGTSENSNVIFSSSSKAFTNLISQGDYLFWGENMERYEKSNIKHYNTKTGELSDVIVLEDGSTEIKSMIPFCYLDEKLYFIYNEMTEIGPEIFYVDYANNSNGYVFDESLNLKRLNENTFIVERIDSRQDVYLINAYSTQGALIKSFDNQNNTEFSIEDFNGLVFFEIINQKNKTRNVEGAYVGDR